MLQIRNSLVHFDVVSKSFSCDINACKGCCCIVGASGAPLLEEEKKILEDIYPVINPYLRSESIAVIEKKGLYEIDSDGDTVTPLVKEEQECVFVIFENDIAMCAIEKTFNKGLIDFQKPLSCHLFPIRISRYKKFDAVNYEKVKICSGAFEKGDKQDIKVHEFCKSALIRAYGSGWYDELDAAIKKLKEEESNNAPL